MSCRIIIAEPDNFSKRALAALTKHSRVECRNLQQEEICAAMETYDVIWIRLRLRVREPDIPLRPRCRVIVTATTGIDHLDVPLLKKKQVRVLSLRGETAFLETIGVTAELTLALMLALFRRLPAAVHSVAQMGQWNRDAYRGVEINGKTAGIVGLGRLGRKMGRYFKALGMKIMAFDPYGETNDPHIRMCRTLDDLLIQSDVVTVHVPLTAETEGLFDGRRFAKMKRGAFFLNTSRGAVVDETALLTNLSNGHLAGAALDVLCGEPAIDNRHPLIRYACRHENLIITPHIGGAVDGVMERCEHHVAGLLLELLEKNMYHSNHSQL